MIAGEQSHFGIHGRPVNLSGYAWFSEYECGCGVYGASGRSPEQVLNAFCAQAAGVAGFAAATPDSSSSLGGIRRHWNVSRHSVSGYEWKVQGGIVGEDRR
jgi:hypothetical protein